MLQPTLQSYAYRNFYEKSSKLGKFDDINSFVRRIFSSPETLNESFKLNLYRFSDKTIHNIDIDFLVRFYDDLQHGRNGQVDVVRNTMSEFVAAIEHLDVPREKFLRAYFITLLNPQFYDYDNIKSLIKFTNIVVGLNRQAKMTLIRWLCDLDPTKLSLLISYLQNALTKQIHLLLPEADDGHLDYCGITNGIASICQLLQLLFLRYRQDEFSNQKNGRVPLAEFRSETVMRHFDPGEQFKLNFKGIRILNFMMFPFLLSVEYKNKLLEIENKVQHQLSMQRGLMNMLNGIIPEENKQNNTVVNAIFFMLQVNRQNILDDSVEKLSKTKANLKNPLKITFIGEPGNDGGGVKKEYFQMVIKQIFNPQRDLFVSKNNRYHWFNGESFEAPIMYEFLGMILGLSIYNNTLLDLKFPKIVYKKLVYPVGHQFDALQELAQVQPDFYQSFKYILQTTDDLNQLELYFEAERQVFGTKIKHPLKPYGEHIKLTQANKHQYVKLYSNWLINLSVEKQFDAFRRGFYKVVSTTINQLFSPQELEKIICGSETLNFKDLEKVVKYEGGFTSQSPTIKALWDILHRYDLKSKKAFLFFVTGSDRAPLRGLSHLTITIHRQSDSENLPSSHTCASTLMLPEYSTREKLQQKLELALQFKQTFGLI